MSPFTLGLALGGGGARGAAHIGVLQVLHRNGIKIDRVAGVSAGAVIGAMYAATLDPPWIEKRFREFLSSEPFQDLGTDKLVANRDPHSAFEQMAKKVKDQFVIALSLHRTSIIKKKRLEAAFEFLLPVKDFGELKIPLDVVVTDLQHSQPVVHGTGDLLEAVVQSGSIPGYVEPTLGSDQILVDGGVSMPNPVPVLKPQVDFVLAVDIKRDHLPHLHAVNIYEVMLRSEQVISRQLTNQMVEQADFILRPDVQSLHWSQFERFEDLYLAGVQEAEEKSAALKRRIRSRRSWFYRWKQWVGRLR